MSEKEGMKKGPWTAAEDAILAEYVQKHGEGNWNSVQKNSGLMRCGKSCRLRWANHLRPNLKKGAFSPEEERTIIELHAKLGNKWARMAAQLPGRTDNEIKNYWNTRLKRRQRAGLPIYPQEMREETTTPVLINHQQQQQHHQFQFGQSLLLGRKRPISCCSPSITDFPSSQRQKITDHHTTHSSYNNFCNYNSPNINTYGNHHHHHHPTTIPNYTNNTTDIFNLQFCDDNNNQCNERGRFVFPMSQVPSFSTALYTSNQKLDGHDQFSPSSPPHGASGLSYSSLLMGGIGIPHDDSTGYTCGHDNNRESASFDELLMGTPPQSLSVDAQNSNMHMLGDKDKDDDPPSSGLKQEAMVLEEISSNSMDDDLSSLLTSFQSSMIPLPDWNRI